MALETRVVERTKCKVERMNKVVQYCLVFSLLVLITSCLEPYSKEKYIERFEQFVKRVEKNHKQYNAKDWEYADARFEKYNTQWYLKFSDEFTVSDQVRIKSCIIRYHTFRNKESLSEILRQLFKEDIDQAHEKLKDYLEKDMDQDLEKLIEGATAIGDSAVKVLEDVINKLEDSF
jgi:hypothetical protein